MEPPLSHGRVRHELEVSGVIGSLRLQFQANFAQAWTVLFGPSGCGKSTILRAMCGVTNSLEVRFIRTTDEGERLVLQEGKQAIPPARRRLGYAPQNGGLFPHLSVENNVSFGNRVRPHAPEGAELVEESLELLRLQDLRNRLPRELSGGERQRVSLARALALPDSCLLLLDEPFAGIDRALRDDLLPSIQRWMKRRRVPVISVTHDVDEVFLLHADVVRLSSGSVVAQGRPADVLADEVERVQRALRQHT